MSDTAKRVPNRTRHRRMSFPSDVRCPCASRRVAGLPLPLAPSASAPGLRPPLRPDEDKEVWEVRYPHFRGGARGQKHLRKLENSREKAGTEPNSEGEVWGSIWGCVTRLPPPFARVECWPNGETLWRCKFMGWRSLDQKRVVLVRYPIGWLPLYVCRCRCRCPCP